MKSTGFLDMPVGRLLPICSSLLLSCTIVSAQTVSFNSNLINKYNNLSTQKIQSASNIDIALGITNILFHDRDKIIDAIVPSMEIPLRQSGKATEKQIDVVINEVMKPLLREHWNDLIEITASDYARILDRNELIALLDFYKTDIGRRIAASQSELATAQTASVIALARRIQPEIVSRISEVNRSHYVVPTPISPNSQSTTVPANR